MSLNLNAEHPKQDAGRESFADHVSRVGQQNEQRVATFMGGMKEKTSGFFRRAKEFGYAAPTLAFEAGAAGVGALNRGKEATLDAATTGLDWGAQKMEGGAKFVSDTSKHIYKAGAEKVKSTYDWGTQQKDAVVAKYQKIRMGIEQRRQSRKAEERNKESQRVPIREQISQKLREIDELQKELAAI